MIYYKMDFCVTNYLLIGFCAKLFLNWCPCLFLAAHQGTGAYEMPKEGAAPPVQHRAAPRGTVWQTKDCYRGHKVYHF